MESDSDYVKLAKQGGQKGRTTRDVAALLIYVRYIFPGWALTVWCALFTDP